MHIYRKCRILLQLWLDLIRALFKWQPTHFSEPLLYFMKHFLSPTEAQTPPAYQTINDGTSLDDKFPWKDRVTACGNSGSWAEDSGVGGVLGCVVHKKNGVHFTTLPGAISRSECRVLAIQNLQSIMRTKNSRSSANCCIA